ncbi:homocysteine S-methyltransferase family protein [Marimonas arenosa]|uniref:Homocysteine S-methyltransferase family protein n=1 Tax=Marimonas arenosa TaxID=1795305 RepID=A0AAE4B3A3_9RHOB|nr:homocysteine S-methyltransferase family protein [Marimonas arenosa]MDQ2089077.1 homocysteine S-methyltransferase family protein [Marimonas arenosa]
MKRPLPHQTDRKFLVFAATGTDLIFNRGVDLPGFASFPLNEDPDARPIVVDQMRDLIKVAKQAGTGCIIDTLTWMANRDRAAPLGYDEERLAALNRTAVAMMRGLQDEYAEDDDVLLALCVGPSRDAYAQLEPMTVEAAREYHRAQIGAVSDTGIDLVNAYTFNQVEEAAGVVLAAGDFDVPVALSLVVETDGRLDNGQKLEEAIAEIDALTDAGAAYFMVNCAHPDHFSHVLTGNPRLQGIVVNASRCSHAELDDATELDDGDPEELGAEVARLVEAYPSLSVIGGCCGTDLRHLREMARRVGNRAS